VAQALLQFQSSHRPQDLWHMVTPDFRRAVVWLQLTSGDNQDMSAVTRHVDGFLAANPPPQGMDLRWAGKTYLNVVWQDAMVKGMVGSLAGAFVAVLLMMIVLFRSIGYGLLAMLPLTITITFIYGLIGWTGKDYDMPIAVLSALTLGLSIDFAIHFIERSREALARHRRRFPRGHGRGVRGAGARHQPQCHRDRGRLHAAAARAAGALHHRRRVPRHHHGGVRHRHAGAAAGVMQGFSPAAARRPRQRRGQLNGGIRNETIWHCCFRAAGVALASPVARAETSRTSMRSSSAPTSRPTTPATTAAARRAWPSRTPRGAGSCASSPCCAEPRTGGDQDFMVFFSRPSDVRGTVFLVAKHVDRDDDRWLYLPGLDLVRRISAGDKRTSFVGSHFFYEDVSGAIRPTTSTRCSRPPRSITCSRAGRKIPARSSSRAMSRGSTANLPADADRVLRRRERVYRVMEVLSVEDIGGHPTVTSSRISDPLAAAIR
jgi:hypothetical protein